MLHQVIYLLCDQWPRILALAHLFIPQLGCPLVQSINLNLKVAYFVDKLIVFVDETSLTGCLEGRNTLIGSKLRGGAGLGILARVIVFITQRIVVQLLGEILFTEAESVVNGFVFVE